MALRKTLVLACVLPAMLLAFGCADHGAEPNPNEEEAPVLAPTNVQAVLVVCRPVPVIVCGQKNNTKRCKDIISRK